MDLTFEVSNQILTRTDKNQIVADSKNYLYAQFIFNTDEWNGGIITALFQRGTEVIRRILDENNRCDVPWEMIKNGYFKVSVFTGDVIPTNPVVVGVKGSGYVNDSTEGSAPQPDIFTQIITRLESLEKASIDVNAVKNIITEYMTENPIEIETLSSEDVTKLIAQYMMENPIEIDTLSVEEVQQIIADYLTNNQITDGKSAYEIAVDNGYEGSETEWLESLKGEPGADGRSITSIETDEANNVTATFSDGTTQSIGQLDVNVQANFLTQNGFGQLRFYDNTLQYYDTNTESWVNVEATDANKLVLDLAPSLMQTIHVAYSVDNSAYKISYKEPTDIVFDGQLLVCVEGIKFVRKLGSEPVDINDGVLVKDVHRKEFGDYDSTFFYDVDNHPTNGEVWYYKAFPYATNGQICNSSMNCASCVCEVWYYFGFKIDQNESDPNSMITYLQECDNALYKPAYMDYNADTFNYGDWADAWFIKNLKPVMLKYDGTVDYELDKNDYTLRADGVTASDVANTAYEGNAMMGFPKVYWKIVDNGDNTANVYISDKKVDDSFQCWSHLDANGDEIDYCYMPIYNGSLISSKLRSLSGQILLHSVNTTSEITYATANNVGSNIWYTEVFCDRTLIDLLLLLIGKTTDTQTAFGNGYMSTSANRKTATTGNLDNKGLFYGTNTTTSYVKVFGMENWWGLIGRRIAGYILVNGVHKVKFTHSQLDGSTVNGYNTTGSGYISHGKIFSSSITNSSSYQYVKRMMFTDSYIIANSSGGSSSTYYTDGITVSVSATTAKVVGYTTSGVSNMYGNFVTVLDEVVIGCRDYINASISCKPYKEV